LLLPRGGIEEVSSQGERIVLQITAKGNSQEPSDWLYAGLIDGASEDLYSARL
jgi:hypothetical protein